jgi:guanine nucleotide-binding protein subunit beta-2-like 1 protein
MDKQEVHHTLKYKGFLKAHGGWITSLAVGEEDCGNDSKREFLISGSRDRTLIKWELDDKKDDDEDREWGRPKKMYTGHSHFISQVTLTSDSRFVISSSWDGSVRFWNIATGKTVQQLVGHKKDVLAVAVSHDDRQIMTGGLDQAIKVWNTKGACKHTVDKNMHTDAVSCVKFYHGQKNPIVVTASWDKSIKVWDNLYMQLMYTFTGHKAQINSIDMVQNSSYLASGSRDGTIMVWDLVNGKFLVQADCDSPVNVVLFSQKLYWLIIGTDEGIKVLNLPTKTYLQSITQVSDINANDVNFKSTKKLGCTSLAWDKSGQHLYSGWTDNNIRVYRLESAASE